MKKLFYITIGILFLSCSKPQEYVKVLDHAKAILDEQPDSALQILDSLSSHESRMPKVYRMTYHLLRHQAQNKAYIPFTSDSIAQELTQYYDSHGTANEQMTAHYLLGCVYRDLGEAPQATDCFLNAIAKADTTYSGCNYHTLRNIYAQLADVYHKQLLLSEEIEASRQASYYSLIVKDTLNALLETDRIAGIYMLLNKRDSALSLLNKLIPTYKHYGFRRNGIAATTRLMYLYMEDPSKANETKTLIDQFENEYGLNRGKELPPSKRQFYYYKGRYYENINKLDSAEICYRSIYRPNMTIISMNPMYKGLLSVFQKRHNADSVAKYAQLYCQVNDSSIAIKDQELTKQITASNNYSRMQKEAFENKSKANKLINALIIVCVIATLFTLYLIWKYRSNKKKKQEEIEKLKEAYANVTSEYNNNIRTLNLLESVHKEVISTIQSELDKEKEKANDYKLRLNEIENKYIAVKTELENENELLKEEINSLKLHDIIKKDIEKSISFIDTSIVQKFLYFAEHSKLFVNSNEWDELITETSRFYPNLVNDLNKNDKTAEQEMRACILVVIGIRESDIARLLNVSPQRITNLKATINQALFNENTARSLYKNLQKHYNIYTS